MLARPIKKIALRLYDIDGCIYGAWMRRSLRVGESIEQWILDVNKTFLEREVNELSKGGYDKVIVGYFTARQSLDVDLHNWTPMSGTPVLPVIQSYLQNKLKCEVVLEPFWTADIFSNKENGGVESKEDKEVVYSKEAGESYKLALKEYTQHATFEEMEKMSPDELKAHAASLGDRLKISFLYAHTHRVANLHPEAKEIDITVYDDVKDILNGVHTFVTSATKLFPSKCSFEFFEYMSGVIDVSEHLAPVVKGTGLVDELYDWTVRFMWVNSYVPIQPASHKRLQITSADDLIKVHTSNLYFSEDISASMEPQTININKFQENLSKLKCAESGLKNTVGKASYTTAQALFEQGLIPISYIIEPTKNISSRF
jgi:hypothetical protein